ncbi:hypothetical protein AB0M57_19960 [Streptomyces sp. NPDC051597]|uniref:hypothetical protein n=1 Tax=Streptomyces sp. NPDC051597 TaxID=3155049 RepID=UPI00341769AF
MTLLSVDQTSKSYAAGQVMGVVLVTAAVMFLVWKLSASWRGADARREGVDGRPSVPAGRRRAVVVAVIAVVAAVGTVIAAGNYHPEARAAQTRSGATATGAEGAPASRVVTAPREVAGYRLLTGDEAERAGAAQGTSHAGKRWYYGKGSDVSVHAVLFVNTVEWDSELGAEKRRYSITREFRNFFAGAKARDVASFDAGPLGGRLSCGFRDGLTGEIVICAWSDASTLGALTLTDVTELSEAARKTTAFREAAEN